MARLCKARLSKQGMAWQGKERHGKTRKGKERDGNARKGEKVPMAMLLKQGQWNPCLELELDQLHLELDQQILQ